MAVAWVGPFGLPRKQPVTSGPWLSCPACFFVSAGCSHLRTSAPGSCVPAGTLPCRGLFRAACLEEEPPSFCSPKPLPPEAAPSLPVLWLVVPGCFPPSPRQGLHWRRHWLGRVAPPESALVGWFRASCSGEAPPSGFSPSLFRASWPWEGRSSCFTSAIAHRGGPFYWLGCLCWLKKAADGISCFRLELRLTAGILFKTTSSSKFLRNRLGFKGQLAATTLTHPKLPSS